MQRIASLERRLQVAIGAILRQASRLPDGDLQAAAGRNRDEASLALSQLGDWLGGADLAPDWPGMAALAPARSRSSRHGAILLPFRALLAAIESAR